MLKKIKAGALALICCLSIICSMVVMITAALTTSVNNDFSISYTPVNGIELGMTGKEFNSLLEQNTPSGYISALSFDYYNDSGDYEIYPAGGGILSTSEAYETFEIVEGITAYVVGYGVYGFDAILILSEKTIIAPVDCSEMFACGDNELFGFCEMINFANFDTSNTTNMANMFVGVGINLDDYLECCICQNFNTEKVTNMSYMFSCCTFMPTLNISSFTISDSCDIDAMLDDCTSLEKVYVGEEMYLNQTWRKKNCIKRFCSNIGGRN